MKEEKSFVAFVLLSDPAERESVWFKKKELKDVQIEIHSDDLNYSIIEPHIAYRLEPAGAGQPDNPPVKL